MALKLTTRARWCVTGTPVHRGLEDLFGLALFLGSRPWNDDTTWKRALCEPYLAACPAAAARAHKWVSGVFWRTQKEDVAHEISLPRQDMLLPEMLRFAPVEYLVYRRQHQECAQAVKEELASMKMNGLETLDDLAKFCRNKKKKLLQEVLTKPLCSS